MGTLFKFATDQRLRLCTVLCLSVFTALVTPCPAEQLPIKTYTIADGLARDTVSNIFQDSHGFIWFSTSEGLSRFDGYRFTNYGTREGLPSRSVHQLLETRNGTYWVATENGLVRFDPLPATGNPSQSHFFPISLDPDAKSKHVRVLAETRNGDVLCGTEKGIYRITKVGNDWQPATVDIGLDLASTKEGVNTVVTVMEDSRGDVWAGTWAGLYRHTAKGQTVHYTTQQGLPGGVKVVYEDHSQRIWVATDNGLCLLAPDPQGPSLVQRVYTTADGLVTNFVTTILQTSNGRLWVGTGLGLNLMEEPGQNGKSAFHGYSTAQGLRNINVNCLREDGDGNLWVGSEAGGAMKLSRAGFTSYSEADGLGSARIAALIEDQAGELCVISTGTPKLLPFNRFDGTRFSAVEINCPGANFTWGWYQTTFQDHLGDWWVNTAKGSYRFPKSRDSSLPGPQAKKIYTEKDGLPPGEVFRQHEDAKGDVWFSTLGDPDLCLGRWERNTDRFYRYPAVQFGIPRTTASAFADDGAGNLWIGFYGGSVARYRDGYFQVFAKADGVPEGFVHALYLDQKHRLWVATGNGVARLNDPQTKQPRFITLTTVDGLSSDQATCITEDVAGNIYVGTGRGVDRLDPETGHVQHYTTADGLPDNSTSVSFRDKHGALWFGTLRGLARLIPEAAHARQAPPILINKLIAGETTQAISELGVSEISNIELGPSENRIQAEFLSLSFNPGETLRYQYRLEGADKDWSAPTEQRTVNFANLSAGNYRFLVRAVNSDGVVSLQPASISFRVSPAVWRRWWFITLAALLVGGSVLLLDRYRIARAQELRVALNVSQGLTTELTEKGIELSKANRTLALDYEVTRILAEAATPVTAAPAILKTICEGTGWDMGALWYVDGQARVLRCAEVWHDPQIAAPEFEKLTRETSFSPGVGLPGRVWQTSEPRWITDLSSDENFPRIKAAVANGLKSAFGFPILLGSEVIGVCEFFSRSERKKDDEVLSILGTIGSDIGQLIERKQKEEALRESEDRFRTLAETASDAIITIDQDSRIVFVNPAIEKVFGYKPEELVGQDLTLLMPEYLRHLHRAGFARYRESGRRHISWDAVELPGLHRSGREVPLELSFGEFTREGRRYFTGVARDITERKQAAEELQRSREERLRELERVRKRIATDLHDDIGSALTQISILSEVANRQIPNGDSPLVGPLTLIANSSRELVDSMSDIVWAINPQKDHLSDLIGRMRRFAADVLSARDIEFRFQAPGSDHDVQLGANVRREVFLIFKESINNLVKHSASDRAEIEFTIDAEHLTLVISDNGKGFETNADCDGHGLLSMRDRAAGLGAKFEMVSQAGVGTRISLDVPLTAQATQQEGA
jgi:PAS domain S-box-containing protein